MINMLDRDYSGKMGFSEFKELWAALNQWKVSGYHHISVFILRHSWLQLDCVCVGEGGGKEGNLTISNDRKLFRKALDC